MGRLHSARRGDPRLRIETLAQWWTQAQDQARFELVQRVRGTKTPLKGDPTQQELYCAIILAETEAGEIDRR